MDFKDEQYCFFNLKYRANLVFDVGLLVLVEMNLEEPGAIETDPGAFANNLGRVDEVIENGIVHSHQSTGPEEIQNKNLSQHCI
jgi:hypothetical protein